MKKLTKLIIHDGLERILTILSALSSEGKIHPTPSIPEDPKSTKDLKSTEKPRGYQKTPSLPEDLCRA